MKLCVVSLVLLVLGAQVHRSESKFRKQVLADDEDEGDDFDDDEEEEYSDSYRKTEIDDDGRIYKNPRNSPSAMCPREEEQADRLGQKCLRKCSTDEDCKSKKKKCRCDGACGMSCIKPDRECPELSDIEHGGMTVAGKFFGDAVRYSCDPGFFVVGLAEQTCRADGHWTGTTPVCKEDPNSFCAEPPQVKNARSNALLEQTTFDLDSTIRYFCHHGYATDGFPTAKCLMKNRAPASWFGPDISCKPRDCGPPANIPNGWHAGECYTYDCRVSYHCEDGHDLVGRPEKVCLADGTWVPKEMPQCVQVTSVQCPPPKDPPNGRAVYTSCSYNSVVSYECKYGFTIVGDATRRCGADKNWSGQPPVCQEINCGPPGILYNGWIENIESGTGLGASIIFRCNPHMTLEGNTSSVCQIDGTWRYPVPRCLAPCIVPSVDKGHIWVVSDKNRVNNVSVVEHGEKLTVVCESGYEFVANRTPIVCHNGSWAVIPSCTPARCKQMPRTPKNGMVIAPKTEHGMRAVFKCKDGYELQGDSKFVECNFGNWTGEIPHCNEVFCPFPGYITNGKVLIVGNMGVYDLRPYVRKIVNNKQIMYDCDRGFVLSEGPPGATCIGGYWSPRELPKCVPGQHPRLRWSRRRRSIAGSHRRSNSSLPYKKVIDFFRRISRKVLHLGARKKPRGHASHKTNGKHRWQSSPGNDSTNSTWKWEFFGHGKNGTGISREKMINFLEIIYQKLAHVDAKQRRKTANFSMHELLNVFSINSLHVDLEEALKNTSAKNGTGPVFRVQSQKEFAKYRRGFERIVRFYSKSESHKKSKKCGTDHGDDADGRRRVKPGKHKHNGNGKYKGFYKFLNNYLEDKLSNAQAKNTTAELIKRMNIDIFTIKNGTTIAISDVYAFFKHIIENKLNVDNVNGMNEARTVGTTEASGDSTINANATVPLNVSSTVTPRVNTIRNNEIPPHVAKNDTVKGRGNRIWDTPKEMSVSFQKRKLLSLDYPLSNKKSESQFDEPDNQSSRRSKFGQLTLNELEAQQQNRLKRFLTPSEIENQIFLKNLYLTAYEDEYRANVKRSIIQSNRTHPSLYEMRGRRDPLVEYKRK
ncbi:protein lev-9-like [Neodiprion lecontei]|uniref:Protein lev-9-like n=1 Tax=Neodiprion lecontei TaxID=441921 RepID=A0A6J0B8N1_NEOLC|nr:protein lev-9-like [Neodiprion lecontei]